MKCSKCGGKTKVMRPYHTSENETIRHRKCDSCGHDMYTVEAEVEYTDKIHRRIRKALNAYLQTLVKE